LASEHQPLVLHNRHTDERLELKRVRINGEVCLSLSASLPPHRDGPPRHIHHEEDEAGTVHRGVLTAWVDGQRVQVGPGEQAVLPKGSAHHWWNEGDEVLEWSGYAKPVVDLDRYLQAVFDVVNAGSAERPPLVYLAHVMLRHRKTQAVLVMPGPIQAIVFRLAYLFGLVTGRYRGDDWPGCPSRCQGAPLVATEDA